MLATRSQEKPTVHVTAADLEHLSELAESGRSPGAVLLARELERAVVVDESEAAHAFVRLGSRVEFRDLLTGRTRVVTVVPPAEADMDQDRLSVLTPVGAALFGLAAGDTFSLSTDGRPRVLEVLRVELAVAAAETSR